MTNINFHEAVRLLVTRTEIVESKTNSLVLQIPNVTENL